MTIRTQQGRPISSTATTRIFARPPAHDASATRPSHVPAAARLCFATALCGLSLAFSPAPSVAEQAVASAAKNNQQQEYCANIAASAEAIRLERRRKELSALDARLSEKLATLEARHQELRTLLDRLEAFERKSGDALIGLYSRMKPDAAALQISQLDDEIAASLMLQLKSKISSAILGEMEAGRGAALAKRIAQLRAPNDGKKP
jgi:flagellar motility protein MotE (MotC chaperone)